MQNASDFLLPVPKLLASLWLTWVSSKLALADFSVFDRSSCSSIRNSMSSVESSVFKGESKFNLDTFLLVFSVLFGDDFDTVVDSLIVWWQSTLGLDALALALVLSLNAQYSYERLWILLTYLVQLLT